MKDLTSIQCIPCSAGAPKATKEELAAFQEQCPDWQVQEVHGVKRVTRRFTHKNFVQALAFTNQVGEIAEAEGHHPSILTEWGKVTVSWWTHKIGGLHQNDFIMAAKTDQLYTQE